MENHKYTEYLALCKEADETPIAQSDRAWATHKGKLCEAKYAHNSKNSNYEQSAADDFIDYLNDRW